MSKLPKSTQNQYQNLRQWRSFMSFMRRWVPTLINCLTLHSYKKRKFKIVSHKRFKELKCIIPKSTSPLLSLSGGCRGNRQTGEWGIASERTADRRRRSHGETREGGPRLLCPLTHLRRGRRKDIARETGKDSKGSSQGTRIFSLALPG